MKPEHFFPPRAFGSLPVPFTDYARSKVVILSVPYDSTTDWRSGSREGPQAIIDASQYLELYDIELEREIHQVGIHTLTELQPVMGGPEAMVERVQETARELIAQNKLPLMLGGEHSLTLGMVRAFLEKHPRLSVLQLDAHADLRNEYLGTKFSHGCIMRRLSELCPIVQVGIRSFSLEESQFIAEQKLKPFYADGTPIDQLLASKILESLTSEVYVTIDLDVFDPSVMAAVSDPEPGGLTWYEVLKLLRKVAEHKKVLGFDLVELCPREGPVACAFMAAKLAYKLIGYATTDFPR